MTKAELNKLRNKLKLYIDNAEERVLKMILAALVADANYENNSKMYPNPTEDAFQINEQAVLYGITEPDVSLAGNIKKTKKEGTEFENEMNRRFSELENGTVKGYILEESTARARQAYKALKR